MFDDYNTLQELPKCLPLFQGLQSQFATRLDQVMLHYQGSIILSIRLNFLLGHEHSDVIDRMISKGIAKGVKRIELLFSYQTTNDPPSPYYLDQIEPYTFPFAFFSETDSLLYLHLEKCHLVAPTTDFSGLKNLRTLVNIDIIASNLSSLEYFCNGRVVHKINIKEAHMLSKFSFRGSIISKRVGLSGLKHLTTIVLDGLSECLRLTVLPLLFSEYLQLEDVTFKNCSITWELEIISPKLRHLNIIDCAFEGKRTPDIIIDALNLSSFEYSGHTKAFYVKAPKLLNVFWSAAKRDKNPYLFGPIATLNQIENLALILNHSQVNQSKPVFVI
ncbi:putative leucine-rich repeat domain, L domain-containing protein [Medicago truncatula]|uniref:Putative leucine-rich repeat domain, L domain-containing protein n=1 Tax=Medicago truncatula TaxID=3880 RepID=A0A396J8T8_MEDTR|nr:putative leucine-rich repeat domain, L domain-containing protein [Medicago truncatula]